MEEAGESRKDLLLNGAEVRQLRRALHELSNLLTGILVSGGLVQQCGQGERRARYVDEVCASGERGAMLVRQVRAMVTEALERSGYPEEDLDEAWGAGQPGDVANGDQIHEA